MMSRRAAFAKGLPSYRVGPFLYFFKTNPPTDNVESPLNAIENPAGIGMCAV